MSESAFGVVFRELQHGNTTLVGFNHTNLLDEGLPDMLKIAWSNIYNHPLPENHRFPMVKYDLIPEQLLYEGTISDANLFMPRPPDEDVILLTHSKDYYERLSELTLSRNEERRTGFPLSAALVEREVLIAGGTLQCSLYALEDGVSMNVAGGTHHAYTDRGEGFCLLNDMAIAARYLLEQKLVRRVLIVDLDVHQGNGTAEIFRKDDRVFTFSMHGEKNYPLKKEQSDRDIALRDGTGDSEYLMLLRSNLSEIVAQFDPDFIFYQSGVDVLKSDKLGRLALSLNGCKERDLVVLGLCREARIPVAISMGGGYSYKLSEIIEAHANTYRSVQELYF